MKFTTVFAVLATTFATIVSGIPQPELKTNAQRLAVGLPPLRPVKLIQARRANGYPTPVYSM